MLFASDEEEQLAPGPKKEVDLDVLLARPCRCKRGSCYQQFLPVRDSLLQKRHELKSLSPEDRVS